MDFLENYVSSIFIEHFPAVIVSIILSYTNRYNLLSIESSECWTYKFLREMFHTKKISASIQNSINFNDLHDIINEKIILIRDSSNKQYKLIDMDTSQIIKKFYYDDNWGYYCASDGKYMIFKKGWTQINIVDINEMKIIGTIKSLYPVTHEIMIVNDIVYLTANSFKIILKYTLSGEYIDKICFEKELVTSFWYRVCIKITHDEIVVIDHPKVLFYDLNGNKLEKSIIDHNPSKILVVTANFMCTRYNGYIYKYKRVL
jgi:hypothetical protein